MKSDGSTALRGVLWQVRGPWWTLTRAELLTAGTPPKSIDGDAVIHRDNIDFVQVLPGA